MLRLSLLRTAHSPPATLVSLTPPSLLCASSSFATSPSLSLPLPCGSGGTCTRINSAVTVWHIYGDARAKGVFDRDLFYLQPYRARMGIIISPRNEPTLNFSLVSLAKYHTVLFSSSCFVPFPNKRFHRVYSTECYIISLHGVLTIIA